MADEQDVILALKQRDPDALAAVFEQYSNRIYRLGLSLLQDEQQADGVVQETFLALIKTIDRFEERASLGTWLYRVAHNEIMSRLRKQRPQLELDDLDEDHAMPSALIDWQTLPESLLSGSEMRAQLDAAIAQLSPSLRAVFTLRDIEELSTRETAAALAISEAAVKVRLHRARLALREKLAATFDKALSECGHNSM